MKNKMLLRLLLGVLMLIGTSSASKAVAGDSKAVTRDAVTFGCVVRLKHVATGKYLTGTDDTYNHPGTSGQPAVYGAAEAKDDNSLWIIKGKHSGDRWNFALNRDANMCSMIGWPVKRGSFLRFENVASGRDLHSHALPSPKTGQREVTTFGKDGLGDTNDDFVVDLNDAASGFEYLAHGFKVKFRHSATNSTLHSHPTEWQPGKNEITTFGGRDDNDWWIIEIAQQPDKNAKIKSAYDQTRATQLSYWVPMFWDTTVDKCDENYGEHRVWAHGGSRHDGGTHDYMELILGPWGDKRAQRGPSFFIIQNADDKFKMGPINFGDRIKIMAVAGGPGEANKAGILIPFRYLWMYEFSRFNIPHREIIISRPEHPSTDSGEALFVLEPVIAGQTGPISSMDLVQIKNNKFGAYLWTHPQNRWNGPFWEILADKDHEDTWGKAHYGTERRIFWGKYRFSLALEKTVADDEARKDLAAVNKEIATILGSNASKQQAVLDAAKKATDEQVKIVADQKVAAEKVEAARLADPLAAAQAAAAALIEKAKNGDPAAQAAAQKAAGALIDAAKKESAQASQVLSGVKDSAEAVKKQTEDDAKAKVSNAEIVAKAEADKVALIAADLQRKPERPVGFVSLPGTAHSIASGSQDHETELADNKGKKRKVKTFDYFGVLVQADGSLGKFSLGANPSNPWQRVVLVDAKGADIKVSGAAVGCDGTTFVISQDGKSLYGISWPDDTAAAMPDESKGFASIKAKDKHREQHAKRHGPNKKGMKQGKGKGAHKTTMAWQGKASAGRNKSVGDLVPAKKHHNKNKKLKNKEPKNKEPKNKEPEEDKKTAKTVASK